MAIEEWHRLRAFTVQFCWPPVTIFPGNINARFTTQGNLCTWSVSNTTCLLLIPVDVLLPLSHSAEFPWKIMTLQFTILFWEVICSSSILFTEHWRGECWVEIAGEERVSFCLALSHHLSSPHHLRCLDNLWNKLKLSQNCVIRRPKVPVCCTMCAQTTWNKANSN